MGKDEQIVSGWSAFVRESIGDLPNKVVAERIGVSPSTVGNWVRGDHFNQPDGTSVVRFARTFGRPLPDALVAAGYGDASEYSKTVTVMREATDMTYAEMADVMATISAEMARRERAERRRRPPVDPNAPAL